MVEKTRQSTVWRFILTPRPLPPPQSCVAEGPVASVDSLHQANLAALEEGGGGDTSHAHIDAKVISIKKKSTCTGCQTKIDRIPRVGGVSAPVTQPETVILFSPL